MRRVRQFFGRAPCVVPFVWWLRSPELTTNVRVDGVGTDGKIWPGAVSGSTFGASSSHSVAFGFKVLAHLHTEMMVVALSATLRWAASSCRRGRRIIL